MFSNNTERLIWLMGVFALALVFKTCSAKADVKSLTVTAAHMGFKPPRTVVAAISGAAKAYGLDEVNMLMVAILESNLNPKAWNLNKNGTIDQGLFQVNEITGKEHCEEYDLWNAKGSAMCAARIMAYHKKSGDPFWMARFHSVTPSIKMGYYHKLMKIGAK